MGIVDELKKVVGDALDELGVKKPEVVLERPKDMTHGDYAFTTMRYRVDAQALAEMVGKRLPESVERVESVGGFVNFHLAPAFFAKQVQEILEQGEEFGKNQNLKGKKIIVEFSSPNIAKPFSIGHLRSTVIGDSIARILGWNGASIVRDNHIGDWGTQFGKLIVAIQRWGNREQIEKSVDPIRLLVGLYVRFHAEAEENPTLEDEARAWFVKLEQGDEEARTLWKQCVGWSLKEFNMLYARLGVSFDTAHGESFFEDKMPAVIHELEQKDLLRESEGARLVFFPNDTFPPLMILKRDGGTLYATRDLATDAWRKHEYGAGVIIVNETGIEQSLYFQQIFMLEEILGWFKKGERVHIGHGLTRGKDGKMSTREGNVVWLAEVLSEAVKRASVVNSEGAEAVGIGALKFNDLKREAKKNIVFDWDEMLNMKGDSGPYLQYSYARACSVLRKAGEKHHHPVSLLASHPSSTEEGIKKDITSLERILPRFPEIVERAGKEYAPHYIATYLIELAGAFNSWYATERILDAGEDTPYRLTLTVAFAQVMKNGLWLLGIAAPPQM